MYICLQKCNYSEAGHETLMNNNDKTHVTKDSVDEAQAEEQKAAKSQQLLESKA